VSSISLSILIVPSGTIQLETPGLFIKLSLFKEDFHKVYIHIRKSGKYGNKA